MNISFIYILGTQDNPVKIGFAADVTSRVIQLQIGCPDPLIVHKALPVSSLIAGTIEGLIHGRLIDHHRRGEWFNIDASAAADLCAEVIHEVTERFLGQQERQDRDRDLIERIAARTPLESIAREAVEFYLSEHRTRRDAKAVRCMNGYILQHAGLLPLELFKRVAIAGDRIEILLKGDRRAIENGYITLALAMNALAAYYHHRKTLRSKNLAA